MPERIFKHFKRSIFVYILIRITGSHYYNSGLFYCSSLGMFYNSKLFSEKNDYRTFKEVFQT